MTAQILIGTQGWNYDAWVGEFYPSGTRAADYLDIYAKAFATVEIDSTFYAIPSSAAVETWRKRAPTGFQYALKMPQAITHVERLVGCAEILAQFCERVRGLGPALGSVLIQLPPDFSPRALRSLANFLPLLPTDIRFAVEFRDQAWYAPDSGSAMLELLAEARVSPALLDSKWIPRSLMFEWLTQPALQTALQRAGFAYVRWMGARELTDFSRIQFARATEYDQWNQAFAVLKPVVPLIYGYFNNHYQGHSPGSANAFKARLGLPLILPQALILQPSLF